MKFNKDIIYSKSSYFWIPTYYDKKNDIYFCEPESKEFVSKFYEKEYWDNFSRKKWLNWKWKIIEKLLSNLNIHGNVYLSDFYLIKNFINIQKSTVLEIGVGFWKNIKYLFKKWINIIWLDIDKKNVENINRDLWYNIVKQWNYEEIKISKQFTLIYLRHVLEHFINIDTVICKLFSNLKSNWYVYINIPNANNKFILNESINNHPHIYHFTKKSLQSTFENHGFTTVKLDTYNFKSNNKWIILLKTLFWIPNLKKDNESRSEFLIWIFKK